MDKFRIILLFAGGVLLLHRVAHLISNVADSSVEEEVEEGKVHIINRAANAPLIAIVACVKQIGSHRPAEFIEHSLLASIYETITHKERETYRIELILGYDDDDRYWHQDSNHHLSPKTINGERIYTNQEPIPISYVSIRKDPSGDRPNRIPFNELSRVAYDNGATYIVRINDDTQFSSRGWITQATNTLKSFSPPNIGVVGPVDHVNELIMTHDMVHAPSHYAIFDTYYPSDFDNYYVDDWISKVYGTEHTKRIYDWEVLHHRTTFWSENSLETGAHEGQERYTPSYHQDKLVDQLLTTGRETLESFLSKKAESEEELMLKPHLMQLRQKRLQVLGTNAIERVDGPMQFAHLSLKRKGNRIK